MFAIRNAATKGQIMTLFCYAKSMKCLVEKGSWSEDVQWELYRSNEQPEESLCTAVFCIAIDKNDKVILMRANRGWGMLGGHIEDEESLREALVRESVEEGGFTPSSPKLYGFRKVTSRKPSQNEARSKPYPFPTSYVLYYWAKTVNEIIEPTGSEVLESDSFSLDEIKLLDTPDLSTIKLGLEDYLGRTV